MIVNNGEGPNLPSPTYLKRGEPMEMKLYEELRVDIGGVALFEPEVYAAGVHTGGWLGVHAYEKVLFIIPLGSANDANATIDISVMEAQDNLGTNAQVLKSGTTITAGAGFATYDGLVLAHVEMPEMSTNSGYTHITLRFTISADDTWAVCVIPVREEREWYPHPGTYTQLID